MNIMNIAEELEAVASSGSRVPGFRKKIVVDADRLLKLAQEARSAVPADILEAAEVIKQKDSILNQATLEARRVKSEAEDHASALTDAAKREHQSKVDDTEIAKAAEAKAQRIKDEATMEGALVLQDMQRRARQIEAEAEAAAAARRDGADQYAREVLFNLEEQLAESLGQVRRGIDALRFREAAAQPSSNIIAPAPKSVPAPKTREKVSA